MMKLSTTYKVSIGIHPSRQRNRNKGVRNLNRRESNGNFLSCIPNKTCFQRFWQGLVERTIWNRVRYRMGYVACSRPIIWLSRTHVDIVPEGRVSIATTVEIILELMFWRSNILI